MRIICLVRGSSLIGIGVSTICLEASTRATQSLCFNNSRNLVASLLFYGDCSIVVDSLFIVAANACEVLC